MEQGIGLDIGTNMLVSAMKDDEGNEVYKKQRDSFFKISPKSAVNRKSIKMSLEGRKVNFIMDGDDFVIVGEDAVVMANERNVNTRRPMAKGVLSPKEKDSLPMIKLLIQSLLLDASPGPLVFSIPGNPVGESFDIHFHREMIKTFVKEMGFESSDINESFAIVFSELLDHNLSGLCISFGAGMINACLSFEGDPLVEFAFCRGGDWIDKQVGNALDISSSIVQIEKERGDIDLYKPEGKIQEAISVYYNVLIEYAVKNIIYELKKINLPPAVVRGGLPVVISGGLVLAKGFKNKFIEEVENNKFPFSIKEIKEAKEPMLAVARGCLLAASI